MYHYLIEMSTHVHNYITKWCIVWYGTGALWDLCNRFIVLDWQQAHADAYRVFKPTFFYFSSGNDKKWLPGTSLTHISPGLHDAKFVKQISFAGWVPTSVNIFADLSNPKSFFSSFSAVRLGLRIRKSSSFKWALTGRWYKPVTHWIFMGKHAEGLVQDCRIFSALAMEILHSCDKPPIRFRIFLLFL